MGGKCCAHNPAPPAVRQSDGAFIIKKRRRLVDDNRIIIPLGILAAVLIAALGFWVRSG